MKTINRREALGALSAFALMGTIAEAQTAPAAPAPQTGDAALATSRVFLSESVPLTHNPAGAAGRLLLRGSLPSGEVVGLRITTLEAGKQFGPMHANAHSELLMVFQGKLELLVEGRPAETAGVGDVIYNAAKDVHTVRNPGDTPVSYFVMAIGGPKPA